MSAVKTLVDQFIAKNTIAIFSKSYCPYCVSAKRDAKEFGTVAAMELDELDNGSEIQNYLQKKTNQRTVPNIFINGVHIGGYSDLTDGKSNGRIEAALAAQNQASA